MTKFDNYAKEIVSKEIGGSIQKWYRWRVFVNDEDSILDGIEYIEYHLDPSMPQSYRIVAERHTNFALDFNSWGSFVMEMTIRFINGKEEKLNYKLNPDNPFPADEVNPRGHISIAGH